MEKWNEILISGSVIGLDAYLVWIFISRGIKLFTEPFSFPDFPGLSKADKGRLKIEYYNEKRGLGRLMIRKGYKVLFLSICMVTIVECVRNWKQV